MPRIYKPKKTKNYKKYDPKLIEDALKDYNTSNKSFVDIQEKYGIPKSVLHRHNTSIMKPQGGQPSLSQNEEDYLIEYINTCSEWGYPLEPIDLRLVIKGYLDKLGLVIKKFKNNMPGVDYVKSFLRRHDKKISLRLSQNIKRSRAAVSPEIIESYFDELEISLQGVPSENIVNYDETNLTDDPGRKRVLVKRSVKYPERVMNHTKGATSIMMAAAADGTILSPYVVYKSLNMYDTWRKNGPKGCRYNCTKSGWFDGATFEDWVRSVALPYFSNKTGDKFLIGDNLASHLSIDLVVECKNVGVRFIFLPSNSTHLTQPLDVAFFRPLKMAWRDLILNWKKTDGRTQPTIPKNVFPSLLKKLMYKIEPTASQNIISGFEKCGIRPINKQKILERLPSFESIEDTNFKGVIDDTVLNMLKEMRYGSAPNRQNNKKKKIEVVPGRSVENIEIDEEVEDNDIAPKPIRREQPMEDVIPVAGPSKTRVFKETEIKNLEKTEIKKKPNTREPKKERKNTGKPKKTENKSLIKKTKVKNTSQNKEQNVTKLAGFTPDKEHETNSSADNELMVNNNNISTTDNNIKNLSNYVIDENVKDFSEMDYSTLDIAEMPVIYEDTITVGDEIEVTTCDKSKPKIRIISQEKVVYMPKKTLDLKNVQVSDKIKIKRPKYYKNEKELLSDLMDTDSN